MDPSLGAKQELTERGRALVAECGSLSKTVQKGCGTESVLRIARASINCETSINNTAHHLAKLRSLTVGMNMDMDSVKAAALK